MKLTGIDIAHTLTEKVLGSSAETINKWYDTCIIYQGTQKQLVQVADQYRAMMSGQVNGDVRAFVQRVANHQDLMRKQEEVFVSYAVHVSKLLRDLENRARDLYEIAVHNGDYVTTGVDETAEEYKITGEYARAARNVRQIKLRLQARLNIAEHWQDRNRSACVALSCMQWPTAFEEDES